MKKYVCLLALIALAGVAASAFAEPASGLRFIRERVSFKTSNGSGGYYDSLVASNGSGQHVDTSSAIPIHQFVIPTGVRTGAAMDTLPYFQIEFVPTGSTAVTAGADSIYLAIQASANGRSWTTVTPTQVFAVAGLDDTAFNGIVLQERGSTNCFSYVAPVCVNAVPTLNAAGENATTAPTELQLSTVSFVRVLIQGDHTGEYELYVKHF